MNTNTFSTKVIVALIMAFVVLGASVSAQSNKNGYVAIGAALYMLDSKNVSSYTSNAVSSTTRDLQAQLRRQQAEFHRQQVEHLKQQEAFDRQLAGLANKMEKIHKKTLQLLKQTTKKDKNGDFKKEINKRIEMRQKLLLYCDSIESSLDTIEYDTIDTQIITIK